MKGGRWQRYVLAHSAYDSRANFNMLYSLDAEAAIIPRRKPSTKSRGSCLGAKAVRQFLLDPERRMVGVSYELRRIVGACNFTVKRSLGE